MTSDGASYLAAMAEPRPLYRVPELATAPVVIVTEGEKAADAARSLGFTVTTSSGGCEAARKSDWTPLAGKHVWILPDHDQAGRKYATEVADTLCRLEPPAIVRVIELPDLPAKGDIVDWIEAHGDAAEPDAMRAELERLGAAAPAWELEEELEPEDLGFRPFPVEALPPAIARITTHVARAIGCDPSFVALPLLTVLGAAIGHTRRLRIKRGWTVPAIIWSVIIGESGTKKTPPFDWVMEPVRRLEKEAHARSVLERKRYEAELECWEREKAAWKSSKSTADPPEKPEPPPALRYLVSDVTLEALAGILRDNPRGVLLAVEELAGWTGSFGRYHTNGTNEQALWLPLYNAMPLFCDRKTGPPGERRIMVPRAGVWIAGTTQPGTLRRILTTEHREAGLAARLLLAWPPRTVKDWSEADVDPELEAELAGIVERLYALHQEPQRDGEPGPLVIEMTPDAKNVYKEFYRRHTREQVALEGDLAAAFSKLEEVAARLALIHHYACVAGDPTRDDPRVVDAASMRAGVTYADWFKHEACRVNELFVESTEDEERRRLVDWIIATGGAVTARDAQRGLRRLRAPGAAEEALEALVAAELGAWTPIPTTERGGQPTRLFTLNRKGSNAAG
jgi:hypothetical protein